MLKAHKRMSPVPTSELVSVRSIVTSSKPIKSCCLEVEETLMHMENYQPLFLNDLAPGDRYARRHWMDDISFQFPVILYKYPHSSVFCLACTYLFIDSTSASMCIRTLPHFLPLSHGCIKYSDKISVCFSNIFLVSCGFFCFFCCQFLKP